MLSPAGLTFEDWIKFNADKIEQAQLFTKSELPTEIAAIHDDLSRTVTLSPKMAELLADMEQHISISRAKETLSVKADEEYGELSAPERKITVEARIAHIVRTRDILRAVIAALHERSYALMSQRAYAREELRLSGVPERGGNQ